MALDGEKLRRIRMAKGISQERLAVMCNVNKRTIQRAERGDPVSLETAAFIADAVEAPAASLRSTQMELFKPASKAWNDVVLVPIASGRRIVEQLQASFSAEISFEIEPTREIIGPLKKAAELLELFRPDPGEVPYNRYQPSYADPLEKQAELNAVLPELANLGVNVFLGAYKGWQQVPQFDMEEGCMYIRYGQPTVEVQVALVVVSDTSSTHFIRRPADLTCPDEIPF